MNLVFEVWRRLREMSASPRGRIVFATALGLVALGLTLPLQLESMRYLELRGQVEDVLARANAEERTPEAVELVERGTVTIGSTPFGGPPVAAIAVQVFDEKGRVSAPRELASFILAPTLPEWAPEPVVGSSTTPILIIAVAVAVAAAAGLTGLGLAATITILATALVSAIAWQQGVITWVIAAAGAGATLLLFLLSTRLALFVLSGSNPVCSIAQGVVREAIRLRVAAFFMGATLVLIPAIVVWISPDQPLRYQVQTFLSRSTGLLYALVATMTLFLGCATTAFELRDRQAWQTLCKPVARWQFLVGKWLGLVVLAVTLLGVGSSSIAGFLSYLRTRPAKDLPDAVAVTEEVLVGRQGVLPEFKPLSREELIESIDREIDGDAILREDIDRGVRKELDVRRTLAQDKQKAHLASLRLMAPGQSREYLFHGLREARNSGRMISLRYKFHAGAEDAHEVHPILLRFPKNGSWTDRQFVAGQVYVFTVPPDLIEDDGTLRIEVANIAVDGQGFVEPKWSINFEPDDLEVLYPVIGFGENYLRALLVDLSKVAFLAMLSVAAASFLSFPIACLLAFSIFAIGSISPFLAISVDYYSVSKDAPVVIQWVQIAIKGVATAANWMLGGFGVVDATEMLVRGRVIGGDALLRVVGGIGIFWTALTLTIGYACFRRKEVAIYSGHG
ncbi:MAG: hypothetical protein O2819_01310 [Planctomycetota bacterium]|nr:hypothetical protein [Planctomycetota bacterium]MDA1104988.1 hypothetical protein [Planctomycetota bacterium]